MLKFTQVSKRLKEAVSMEGAPQYMVQAAIPFDGENSKIHGKLKHEFNNWQTRDIKNSEYPLTPVGCCEIGSFTGNQLLRIFSNLLRDRKSEPGEYLDFLVNGEVCFIILFVKDRAMSITQPEERKEKRLFSKLFDDELVKLRKNGAYSDEYTDEAIRQLRENVKEEYSDFLDQRLAECSSLKFRDPFLGLLLDLAVRMDEDEPFRKVNEEIKLIPFPACIKLAFAQGMSGLVTKLLGEKRFIMHDHELDLVHSHKAETAVTAWKLLIESEIPRVKKGNRSKAEAKIARLVNEIHELYKMKDN